MMCGIKLLDKILIFIINSSIYQVIPSNKKSFYIAMWFQLFDNNNNNNNNNNNPWLMIEKF